MTVWNSLRQSEVLSCVLSGFQRVMKNVRQSLMLWGYYYVFCGVLMSLEWFWKVSQVFLRGVSKHYHGFWAVKKGYWSFWGVLWRSSMFWGLLSVSHAFLTVNGGFEMFSDVLCYFETFEILSWILSCSVRFLEVQKHSMTFWFHVECFRGFWIILKGSKVIFDILWVLRQS